MIKVTKFQKAFSFLSFAQRSNQKMDRKLSVELHLGRKDLQKIVFQNKNKEEKKSEKNLKKI
jgi:hypothetical protein